MLTDNLQDLDEGDVREVEKGLIKQINELSIYLPTYLSIIYLAC